MASANSEEHSEMSLKSLFEKALENYVYLTTDYKVPGEHQPQIKSTIAQLEEVTRLINAAQIFSSNEMLEEVATENIQFLAIPCMLGDLAGKLQTGDRLSNIEASEIYYKDYLKRLKEYNMLPEAFKTVVDGNNLTKTVLNRNEVVRKFEEQKKINLDMIRLKENLERADEEDRRKYFILFVKSKISYAETELRSIAMEKQLLQMRAADPDIMKKAPKKPITPKPLEVVTIVRSELEKKVFGLGYPSRPTMTVQEFYEDRVREGIFPSGPSQYASSMQQREDPEVQKRMEDEDGSRKDTLEEADDEEELQRQRNMDEFKDEHRRGFGNRHNRS